MCRIKLLFLLLAILPSAASAVGVKDETLRLDYIFSGTSTTTEIALSGLKKWDGWSGRHCNLKDLPIEGNGQLIVTSCETGDTLYRMSFSTLFQEWQATPEAKSVRRTYENTFLVPMPQGKSDITVSLNNSRKERVATFTHTVDPNDILIREAAAVDPAEIKNMRYISRCGDPHEKIDVVIVAEGYTAAESELFYADAASAVDALCSHEPFASCRSDFNFLAVAAPSVDSGVSVPRDGEWKNTAVNSNFDTFYSDRYLTTHSVFKLHDILAGLPYEHIIILANTDTYGGGGIYNSYTLTTAHHPLFKPVVVHEFGHSFAGLADEYDYAGEEDPYYFADVEPWEQNITTKFDFKSKWMDMMGVDGVSLIEGAGYQSKGVWRSREDCRMRTNRSQDFCPVCRRAIQSMIDFYLGR